MSKKLFILLFLILAVAALFRFFWLTKSPPSLNWDEAALGYNSYSLLKTGQDEYGHPYPLVLRSFDDYKPALYAYLTMPVIAVFGLNEFSVRFLSAFSGVMSVGLIFFIAKKLFNEKVAVFSAILMAFEPWSVHFSRAAFEANLGLTFILAGILTAIVGRNSIHRIVLSILFFGIAAYSYHAYRVLFIPLILLTFWQNKESLKNKKTVLKIFLAVFMIALPLFYVIFSGEGFQRLQSTSITKLWQKDKSVYSPTDNPVYNFGKDIVGRYFAYFSPANVFVRGVSEPNQKIPGFGIFYTFDFIFFILGIYSYAKKSFKPRALLYLLIISPIPAIITWNWFSPLRTLLLYALFTLILGLGAEFLEQALFKNSKLLRYFVISFIFILYINSVMNLATTLIFYLPYAEKGNWQYGFREIMNYVGPIADNYDKVIFETGHAQPHIFTLFYSKYDPARYHQDLGSPNAVEKPRKNFNFGKYEFRKIYWPDDRSSKNTLFIGSEYSLPSQDVETAKNAGILIDIKDTRGDFVSRIVETK